LMSSVKIDSTMFIPDGFSGEVQLERDSLFFRGAEPGYTSLEVDIKLPGGSVSNALSRKRSFRDMNPSIIEEMAAGTSGNATDASSAMLEKATDELSEEEEPGLDIREALKDLEDITEDAGENCTIAEAMEAERQSQESYKTLGGYVNELRIQILEMEKEIRDLHEDDILHGKKLQVLSSTSKLIGSPTPHLTVGKPIFGVAAAARANAKQPRGQSIAVQTEESQDAEAESESLNALRAEALSLKFKLKEIEISNEKAQTELQVISEELGETPVTTSI